MLIILHPRLLRAAQHEPQGVLHGDVVLLEKAHQEQSDDAGTLIIPGAPADDKAVLHHGGIGLIDPVVALGHHIQMAHDTDLVLTVTEINIAAVPLMILGTEAIVPAPLQSKVQHLPAILTVGGAGLGQIGPGYRRMGDPELQLLDHLLLMVGDPLVHKGFYHFLICHVISPPF